MYYSNVFVFLAKNTDPPTKTGMYNNNNNQRYLTRVTLDSVSTEKLVALDPNNYYNKNKYILKYLSYLTSLLACS